MKKILLILLIICSAILSAQNVEPEGSIQGKVIQRETKTPLTGVNVYIKNAQTGAATDSAGNYVIKNIPVGLINIVFSFIGYEQVTKTDINIKPDRAVILNIELNSSAVQLQDVVVSNGYFSELENKPSGTVNFSSEEISRSPGTAGDVEQDPFHPAVSCKIE